MKLNENHTICNIMQYSILYTITIKPLTLNSDNNLIIIQYPLLCSLILTDFHTISSAIQFNFK